MLTVLYGPTEKSMRPLPPELLVLVVTEVLDVPEVVEIVEVLETVVMLDVVELLEMTVVLVSRLGS